MNVRAIAVLAAATALALPMGLIGMTTASAQVSIFDDATGDTHARSDIKWVEVTHSKRLGHLKVRVRLDQIRTGVELVVYVDRRLGNPGPELRMVAYPDSEWALFRVNKWGQRGRLVDTCGRVRYSNSSARPIATWKAGRECLKLRQRVRVAVMIADPGHGVDWAPKRRTFFPAVSATGHP